MKHIETLEQHPYNGTNNRKKTLSRLKTDALTQSIPVFDDHKSPGRKIMGYIHVFHGEQVTKKKTTV